MSRPFLHALKDCLHGFLWEDSGQGTIEYLLLLALICLLGVSASNAFSIAINSSVNVVTSNLKHHMNHGKHKGQGQ